MQAQHATAAQGMQSQHLATAQGMATGGGTVVVQHVVQRPATLDELDAVRAELGEMRAWKARANEELRATRDANRDLARRAEEAEAEIAALAEGSVERRALPSIGEEEDASFRAATANAAVSPPPRPLPSDARGPGPDPHAAANGESSDALTREMWAELQRARARYDALLGKHARQSRRLRRAARGLGVPRGEPPEDLDELELELELELSDPTDDSARSEDDAGRAERRGGFVASRKKNS